MSQETNNVDLITSLNTIDGLDPAEGLRALRGQFNGYIELLRMFASYHSEDASKLATLLEAGKQKEATMLMHTLKGVSGSLGMAAIQQCSQALELGLKQGDTQESLQPKMGELGALLSQMVRELLLHLPD